MPAVIVENDTSQWQDETGAVYHFPKRYQAWLAEGTEVIYYKGRIQDKTFASARLSADPHYFGMARIGKVYADLRSDKGDLFALIENFTQFEGAIPSKINGAYLETIPATRVNNYWRDGVRSISQLDYDAILSHAKLLSSQADQGTPNIEGDPLTFESANEGSKSSYFGTRYERRKDLRVKPYVPLWTQRQSCPTCSSLRSSCVSTSFKASRGCSICSVCPPRTCQVACSLMTWGLEKRSSCSPSWSGTWNSTQRTSQH
nr:hypothetical protein [Pseudomonas sp. WS 5407]